MIRYIKKIKLIKNIWKNKSIVINIGVMLKKIYKFKTHQILKVTDNLTWNKYFKIEGVHKKWETIVDYSVIILLIICFKTRQGDETGKDICFLVLFLF